MRNETFDEIKYFSKTSRCHLNLLLNVNFESCQNELIIMLSDEEICGRKTFQLEIEI